MKVKSIDTTTGKTSYEMFGGTNCITGAANINSNSYAIERRFIYAGTNNTGAIVSMKVNAFKISGNSDFDLRVVRSSDGVVICELTGNTNTDDADLLDLGTISNLPTEHEVLELQGRVGNGSTSAFLGAIYFED